MKKITIMALHLGYGGVEKYIANLCNIIGDDYDINIISTYKLYDEPIFKINKRVKIKYLIDYGPNKMEFREAIKNKDIKKILGEIFKGIKTLYLKRKLNIEAIKNINSDYIITTRYFHNKLVGKYANKDIIKIATEHNDPNNNQKYVKRVVSSIKNFNYFITVSKGMYNFYKNRIGNTKCIYIPNTIDYIPEFSSPRKSNTIISVGRLSKEKGFIDLISVINIVRQQIPDIVLHLVGDGDQKEEIVTKINSLGLENNIIVHGFLRKDDIEELMMDSSVYVMTSFKESFGLVLLEAFSYGLPCVAFSSAAGARELINKNNDGLVSNRDKYSMARAIVNLLKDKNKLNILGNNAKNGVYKYSKESVYRDWINLLR